MDKKIFEQSYKWEKGLVNNPNDKGGWTNDGITIVFYRRWCKVVLGKEPNDAHFVKLKKYPDIFRFYAHIFERTLCHRIKNPLVASIVFDFVLNSGFARREIQEVLRDDLKFAQVRPDNIFGPVTIGAINDATEKLGDVKLCTLILDKREAYIRWIIQRDPSQRVFEKGWMNRINDFRKVVGII